MKQAEISVLNGLYKNAAVGKDAIFCVLEHTQDPDLRKELCTQLDYYETQQQKNPAADENILSVPQRIGHARKGLQQCQHSPALSGQCRQPPNCKTNGGRNKHGLDSAFPADELSRQPDGLCPETRGRNDAAGRSVLESSQALSLRRNRYGIWKTTADTHRCSGKNLSATGKIRGGSATDWLFRPCSSSYL